MLLKYILYLYCIIYIITRKMLEERQECLDWKRFLIRDEFLKIYLDNLGLENSFKAERFVYHNDILRKKEKEKFLFGIAKTNGKSESFIPNEKDQRIKLDEFILMYPENSKGYDVSINFLSLAFSGIANCYEKGNIVKPGGLMSRFLKKLNDHILHAEKKRPSIHELDDILKSDTILHKEHNKIVDEIFENEFIPPSNSSEENDSDSFSLFFLIGGQLLEYIPLIDTIRVNEPSGVTESNVREMIFEWMKKENNEDEAYIDDFTVFSELLEVPKEEPIASNFGEFLVILASSILFIVNFMIIVPESNFFELRETFRNKFETNGSGEDLIAGINDYIDLQDYFLSVLLPTLYSELNTNNYRATVIPNQPIANFTTNQKKSNVTELRVNPVAYYLYDSNIFSGMMVNFRLANSSDKMYVYETTPDYFGPLAVQQEASYLTHEMEETPSPLYPGSFEFFFKPNINVNNHLHWYKQQIIPAFISRLYEMSFTIFMFNGDYDIAFIYSMHFSFDTFGSMEYTRHFQGFNPLVNTNEKYTTLLILNIFYLISFAYVGYNVVSIFTNRLFDLIRNQTYTFEWFDWVDFIVFCVSLASIVMFYCLVLFRKEMFPIQCTNKEEFNYWLRLCWDMKGYQALTGVTMLLIMIRFVRFIYTAFPSFGILFQTLGVAGGELATLLLIVGLMLVGIFMMAHSAFGWYSEAYAKFPMAFMSIYLMFLGIFDYGELQIVTTYHPITPYFFIAFYLFFNMILLNIFLCIVRNNYSEIKANKQMINDAFLLITKDNTREIYEKFMNFLMCSQPNDGKPKQKLNKNTIKELIAEKKSSVADTNNIPEDGFIQLAKKNFGEICYYNWRNMNLDKLFQKSVWDPETFDRIKTEKYRQIRKNKMTDYAKELQIDINKEFDDIINTFCFILFILIYILLLFFQMRLTFGNNVTELMTRDYVDTYFGNIRNLTSFPDVKTRLAGMIEKFYSYEQTLSEQTNCTTQPKFNTEPIPNYKFLNAPYFRINLRQFIFLGNNDTTKNQYFPYALKELGYLDSLQCPHPSESTFDVFFKMANADGQETQVTVKYKYPGTYATIDECGGFVWYLDSTFPYCEEKFAPFLHELFANNLGSISVESFLFSKFYDYLVYLKVSFMRGPFGKVKSTFDIVTIPINRYVLLADFQRTVLEIIYYAFILYFLLDEFGEIFDLIKQKLIEDYLKAEGNERFANSSLLNKFLRIDMKKYAREKGMALICKIVCDVLSTLVYKAIIFVFIAAKSVMEHIVNDLFNLIDLLSILLSVAMIVLWFQIIAETNLLDFTQNEIYNSSEVETSNDLMIVNSLSNKYSSYIFWQSINLFIIFMRMIQFFKFSKSIFALILVIIRAKSTIFFYLLFLFILNFGFVLFGYALFCQNFSNFSTIPKAILDLFIILAGKISTESTMYLEESGWGPIFFLIFTAANYLLLLNILYSILIESYMEIKNRQKQNLSGEQQINFFNNLYTIFQRKGKFFLINCRDYTRRLHESAEDNEKIKEKLRDEKSKVVEQLKDKTKGLKNGCCSRISSFREIKENYYHQVNRLIEHIENNECAKTEEIQKLCVMIEKNEWKWSNEIRKSLEYLLKNKEKKIPEEVSKINFFLQKKEEIDIPLIKKLIERLQKIQSPITIYNKIFAYIYVKTGYLDYNNPVDELCQEEQEIQDQKKRDHAQVKNESVKIKSSKTNNIIKHPLISKEMNPWETAFLEEYKDLITNKANAFLKANIFGKYSSQGAKHEDSEEKNREKDGVCSTIPELPNRVYRFSKEVYSSSAALLQMNEIFCVENIGSVPLTNSMISMLCPDENPCYQRLSICEECVNNKKMLQKVAAVIYDVIVKHFYRPEIKNLEESDLYFGFYLEEYLKSKENRSQIKLFTKDIPSLKMKAFKEDIEVLMRMDSLTDITISDLEAEKKKIKNKNINTQKTKISDDVLLNANFKTIQLRMYFLFVIWDSLYNILFFQQEEWVKEIQKLSKTFTIWNRYLESKYESLFFLLFTELHCLKNQEPEEKKLLMRKERLTGNVELIDEQDKQFNFYCSPEKFMVSDTKQNREKIIYSQKLPPEKPKILGEIRKIDNYPHIFKEMWRKLNTEEQFVLFFGYCRMIHESSTPIDKIVLSPNCLEESSNKLDILEYFTPVHRADIFLVLDTNVYFNSIAHSLFKKLIEKNDKLVISANEMSSIKNGFDIMKYFLDNKVNFLIAYEFFRLLFKKTLSSFKKYSTERHWYYRRLFYHSYKIHSLELGPVEKITFVKFLNLSLARDKFNYFKDNFASEYFCDKTTSKNDFKDTDNEIKDKIYDEIQELDEKPVAQTKGLSNKSKTKEDEARELIKIDPLIWACSLNPVDMLNTIRKIHDQNVREFYLLLYGYLYDDLEEDTSYYFKRQIKLNLVEKYEKYSKYLEELEDVTFLHEQRVFEDSQLQVSMKYLEEGNKRFETLRANWKREAIKLEEKLKNEE